ncbi:MAG: gliding motility-associated C-terminal domain-containing protein [Ferruginibacter sp.]
MRKVYLLVFSVFMAVMICCTARAAVNIDSLKTTTSTCTNNGSVIIYAKTTTGSLLYALTAGPVTFPVQTSNNFSSLPPGNYTAEVSNTSNEKQTINFLIAGNYVLPDFTPVVVNPDCPANNTGSIQGSPDVFAGLPPYTWELVAPSQEVRSPQSSDLFQNLPAGNYTLRMTDACNNIQTKGLILFSRQATLTYIYAFATITGCDTAEVTMGFNYYEDYRPPYKVSYTFNGVPYTVNTPGEVNSGQVQLKLTVPHATYGSVIDNITATDNCSTIVNVPTIFLSPLFINPVYTPRAGPNCDIALLTQIGTAEPLPNQIGVVLKPPVTITTRDAVTNALVEQKVYGRYENYVTNVLEPNASYIMTISDSCNKSYTTTITTPPIKKYISPGFNMSQPVLDSTIILSLTGYGFPTTGTTITFTGGPAYVRSTKRGYAYYEEYTYPKTFTPLAGSDSSITSTMYNTGPGKYYYYFEDSCGNRFYDSVTINQNDVISHHYNYNYTKGCAGESGLQYEFSNNTFAVSAVTDIKTGTVVGSTTQTGLNPVTNVINNIKAADYELAFNYYSAPTKEWAMNSVNGVETNFYIVRDTIHLIPYQNPLLKTSASTSCNAKLYLTLTADSARGIPPYQYEIISGPQMFPPQTENIFELTQPGIYRIRLIDKCGNSNTADVTVDNVTFPPITKIGNSCINGNAELTLGASPYFSYTWTKPNGATYAGDTLVINPVTVADTGVYTITRLAVINGCSNTESTTYRLTAGSRDSININICKGDAYQFGNRTLNQQGIYRDTFPSAGCDSISVLNLQVFDKKQTNKTAAICKGQSFQFGNRTLTAGGIYRDTIPTVGCDSISILILTVSDYKRGSSAASVCKGQTYTFGNRILTQDGVYTDTLKTTTCDSIAELTLTIGNYKRGSSTASVCKGQSYTFGSRVLTQSGVYTDTLKTASCDSIAELTLTIGDYKRGSSTASVCKGQTYSFGNRVLTQIGVYSDTLKTASCDSIIELTLTIGDYKRGNFIASICKGQNYILGSRTLTQSGVYTDTLKTASCDSIVELTLTVDEFKRASLVAAICTNETYLLGSRSLTETGIYTDTLKTASCDSIVQVDLTVNELPLVKAQVNKTAVIKGETVFLTALPSGQGSYLWTSDNAISNAAIFNPQSVVNLPSFYWVTVTGANNCKKTDSVYVRILSDTFYSCSKTIVYIPSAFTPNGDGHNDVFKINGFNGVGYKNFYFAVYNRWGNMIFETNNPTMAWDGRYGGKPAGQGNYVYYLRFECENSRIITRKGNIILLR